MSPKGSFIPAALISVDLDDSWAYLRTRGDPRWEEAPTVLDIATERLLDLFAELGITATVFIVGRDARTPAGREAIRAFFDAGHEIASHSLDHRFDLARLHPEEIETDLRRAAEEIASVVGSTPRGFRSPSFGVSAALHRVLSDRGYLYDASLLPTAFGPILRRYHHRSKEGQVGERQEIFGPASDGLLPLEAFAWVHRDFSMREIPVTTVPLLRAPMHMSYLHAIGSMARPAADFYLRSGLALCRWRRLPVSFLIHPPDVLDSEDAPSISYLPGMSVPWREKVDLVRRSLSRIIDGRVVQSHGDYARGLDVWRLVSWRGESSPPDVRI